MAKPKEASVTASGEGSTGATIARVELSVDPDLLVSIDWSRPGASLDRVAAKNIITRRLNDAARRATSEAVRAIVGEWDAANPGSEPADLRRDLIGPATSETVTYRKSGR